MALQDNAEDLTMIAQVIRVDGIQPALLQALNQLRFLNRQRLSTKAGD